MVFISCWWISIWLRWVLIWCGWVWIRFWLALYDGNVGIHMTTNERTHMTTNVRPMTTNVGLNVTTNVRSMNPNARPTFSNVLFSQIRWFSGLYDVWYLMFAVWYLPIAICYLLFVPAPNPNLPATQNISCCDDICNSKHFLLWGNGRLARALISNSTRRCTSNQPSCIALLLKFKNAKSFNNKNMDFQCVHRWSSKPTTSETTIHN